jgi:excisionase family DNA binding protein
MKTLSTTEVARILGVTRERVRQLCDEGKLKAEKMGRDWRILPRSVEEYQISLRVKRVDVTK